MLFREMLSNGYENGLTEVQELAVSMGNWAFPMNVAREKERQPAWPGCTGPLRASVPAVSGPCPAVLFYFFPPYHL